MSFKQKAYLDNSYLDVYHTTVKSCEKNEDNKYNIILEKTIFYPDLSGGQPKDEGTINNIEVLDVYENGDDIIHVLNEPVYNEVELKINFQKRFDHMQQHTGQHLLSCAFNNLYHAKTIGFHLSGEYTSIDLNVESFTLDMIRQVEEYSNQIIYDNCKIDTQILLHDEALKTGLRKDPVDDELIRIVKIGDKDNVACCGTHLSYTGEVGIVKIIKYEKYKAGTRVEFLCGKRALIDYINKNNAIHKLSNSFSCHTSIVVENIEKFKNESSLLSKKMGILQSRLDELEANDMMNNAAIINNEKHIIKLLCDKDIKQMRFVAAHIIKEDNYLCGFIIKNNDSCSILLAQSSNLQYDLKDIFNQCALIIEAKGGGNNQIIQGTGKKVECANECLIALQTIITNER